MKGRKRLSPFQKLVREIEGCLTDTVYQAQLASIAGRPLNDDFVLGQIITLRALLTKAYEIYNSRSLNIELADMPVEEWITEYHKAMDMRD